MTRLRIAIHGAAGRMGQKLVAATLADPALQLVAAVDVPSHPKLGQDAGVLAGTGPCGVALSGDLTVDADAVIDFSLPVGTARITQTCLARHTPLIVATTGLNAEQIEALRAAAQEIPVVWAPNMSVAVNLGLKLAAVAGEALKDKDADVEILERHHRFKEDAPSGTALKFGEIIAEAMGQTIHRHGREGRPGRRPHEEIGYHAIRVGDNPGEHTIIFGMIGETLELTVRANRDCYAAGAMAAAKFLAGKPVGLYSMFDVLGL